MSDDAEVLVTRPSLSVDVVFGVITALLGVLGFVTTAARRQILDFLTKARPDSVADGGNASERGRRQSKLGDGQHGGGSSSADADA